MRAYWSLTKGKQTLLLLTTGWAGYSTVGHPPSGLTTMLPMLCSLYLAICGSTVLNMVIDRDLDAQMRRTARRPLATGFLKPLQALLFGLMLSAGGIGWALLQNALYGWIVAAGLFFDVVVYSIWLKRLTPFSIILGGISGGMPILAGRALGLGGLDPIGGLLALAVLLWIPAHIMTFNLKYAEDYQRARIPTFPSVYGEETTLQVLFWSTVLMGFDMILAISLIGINGYYLAAFVLSVLTLIGFAVSCCVCPSPKRTFGLFKAASVFMLYSMLAIGFAGHWARCGILSRSGDHRSCSAYLVSENARVLTLGPSSLWTSR